MYLHACVCLRVCICVRVCVRKRGARVTPLVMSLRGETEEISGPSSPDAAELAWHATDLAGGDLGGPGLPGYSSGPAWDLPYGELGREGLGWSLRCG